MTSPARREGFTLIGAIFLLVVLSSAGAFMLNLGGVQRTTATFALMGVRSYYAARSGVEWAVYQAIDDPATCPAGAFPLTEGGLAQLDVTVTCTSADHVENVTTIRIFHITSVATHGSFGDPHYVSRRMEAKVAVAL